MSETTWTIEPFETTDEGYEAIFNVERLVWPDNPTTIVDFKHGDAVRKPETFFQRVVVPHDGRVIAFASCGYNTYTSDVGHYRFNITVHPAYENQGIGSQLYDYLMTQIDAQTPRVTAVSAGTYAHKPQSIRFLEKRSFSQVMRWIISTLAVQEFNPIPFQALGTKLAGEGIEIRSLPEQQAVDPNWQENLWNLDWVLTLDEPLPSPPQKMPLEKYLKEVVDSPTLIQDAWYIATVNGRYVGMTQLEETGKDGVLSTGFTGVVRDYRRKGLATWLKVLANEHAKQMGVQIIRTGNEESNPMYVLNQKLDFTDLTAFLAFEKQIDR